MKGLGSGDNGEFTFLDVISLISFCVGLENLDLNIAQEDLDNQTKELDAALRSVVNDIHHHLQLQDTRLTEIIIKLEDLKNGNSENNE